jgi:hypothetical protein
VVEFADYRSYLVRIWREPKQGQSATTSDWHGTIEHLQSGRRWTFATLEEMMDLWRGSPVLDDLACAGKESEQAPQTRRN